jgi:hypothetical protein
MKSIWKTVNPGPSRLYENSENPDNKYSNNVDPNNPTGT